MDVFIAGATGYIGTAVARRLRLAGHRITGLARSVQAEQQLRKDGVEVLHGSLDDTDLLATASATADATINLAQPAFEPSADFEVQMQRTGRLLRSVAEAIAEGASTNGRTVIFTGGTGAYGDTGDRVVDEDTPTLDLPFLADMAAAERTILDDARIRGISVRPGIVYGNGGGPLQMLIDMARSTGAVHTFGDGKNHLSTVHIDDLAEAYLLLLAAGAGGHAYNVVNEPWPTQLDIQRAIAEAIGAPSPTPLPDDLAAMLGPASGIFARNSRVTAQRIRTLGWTTRQPDATTTIRQD